MELSNMLHDDLERCVKVYTEMAVRFRAQFMELCEQGQFEAASHKVVLESAVKNRVKFYADEMKRRTALPSWSNWSGVPRHRRQQSG